MGRGSAPPQSRRRPLHATMGLHESPVQLKLIFGQTLRVFVQLFPIRERDYFSLGRQIGCRRLSANFERNNFCWLPIKPTAR